MLKVNIQSFKYPNSEKEILSQLSFQLKKGECMAILGESGCGKSTLLHIMYGLLNIDKGEIYYGKKQLFGPSHNLIPGHDCMKLVSQEFNLMPFTSVAENVGENLPRVNTEEDYNRIGEVLETVGLLDSRNRKVKSLSGGQKQRVALAKALANVPEVLLLDEPFSSIDALRKNHLRRNLFNYAKKHTITCITATHDAEEALAFSDKLLVLKNGETLQMGTPAQVYASAASVYEKSFFGEVSTIPAGILSKKELLLFPHQLKVSEKKTPLKVKVEESYFKGRAYLISCEWNSKTLFFEYDKKLAKDIFVYLTVA
ncbi:ABC transporter ATP-binding protein [Rasiella sp. SM2506]|uniref:ABC transporter ATP-binding protein n=1 Tax=Rasiella sp. SM2506 TaxID=3423914 RepID=UPI003D7A38CF